MCPHCGSGDILFKSKRTRRFLAPPIGGKHATIVFDVPRIECRDCRTIAQVKIPFVEGMRRHIRAFGRYVLDLLRSMTCRDVADHLGISWGMIRDIEARHLKSRYETPMLKEVKRIAIDEIAVRKGHTCMTVVLDLDPGRVIFVGDGRGGGDDASGCNIRIRSVSCHPIAERKTERHATQDIS